MSQLSSWLQRLIKKNNGEGDRTFASDTPEIELSTLEIQSEQFLVVRENQTDERTTPQEFEVFPEDPAVRKQWFSLTIRERQVVALVCMGHRNYEIASILNVEYSTIQTDLQNIFYKFGLRSRQEIRTALMSWPAEEWWNYHHY